MKAELAQLMALQNADTNIRRLQAEIESIPDRRAEIEREFDLRAFEIRALEELCDNARNERTRLETEIFEQKQRAERADRNLMAAKKPDEFAASHWVASSHSARMFAALMIGHHFWISAACSTCSASGVCCSRTGIS